MRKKAVNQINIQEILVLTVLIVIAIAMLINFSYSSKSKLREMVEDNATQELETYSALITAQINTIEGAVSVAGQVLADNDKLSNTDIQTMLAYIPTCCNSYQAVYCRPNGAAMTSGGRLLYLNETDYFEKLQGDSPFFLYTEDDGVMGSPAIVYVRPIIQEEETLGYLMAYLDGEFPVSAVQNSEYGSKAFFAILEKNGEMRLAFGNVESTKLLQDNFWVSLKPYIKSNSDYLLMERQIAAGMSGMMYVAADEEERLICVTPIKSTSWILLMGLEENAVSVRENRVWDNNGSFQIWISLIMVGMLVVIVIFNVLNRVRNVEHSRELENKADTDLLTGLNNKIATERKIAEYMAANQDSQAMMVVLDVDNFKKINDTLGHSFGDEVLRELGHRLRAMFRASDILGRLGGDEFIILLKDIRETAQIEREGKKLEEFFHHFEVGEYVKYSVTASLGAAVFPRDANDFEGMYKAADSALYVAKRRGKNQLAFYEKNAQKEENA
ncbi:MAG: sensor domain-containing diguanylate cyclase [Candidatus Gastranaerophilales bacterium]|nr:sensor domain-containing diguanylate cyclase [Candidatus Gastranaerophilales bacterium]